MGAVYGQRQRSTDPRELTDAYSAVGWEGAVKMQNV